MQTYNPKNPRVQSVASLTASALQAELAGFGVVLTHEDHFELQRLMTKYPQDDVKVAALKALDRYTNGTDPTANGFTAEEYVMEKLKRHNWNGNNNRV